MPDIHNIELLEEAKRYGAELIAHCPCGHSGPIAIQMAIDRARTSHIERIGEWVSCRRCSGSKGYPRLELVLPSGQRRIYHRSYGQDH